jgi:formylglycine-generating enzyme required for sulfatase activity
MCLLLMVAASSIAAQAQPIPLDVQNQPLSPTFQFPEMVLIPGGQFLMGDHHNYVDPAHPSAEVPTHTVHLNSFYMFTTGHFSTLS